MVNKLQVYWKNQASNTVKNLLNLPLSTADFSGNMSKV